MGDEGQASPGGQGRPGPGGPDSDPGPDLDPGLGQEMERELAGLDGRLRSPLLRALADEPRPLELAGTALSLARGQGREECRRAFIYLARLAPGPLRGWWLRTAFDLPGLTSALAKALAGFLGSGPDPGPREGPALELCRKAPRVIRAVAPAGGSLLELTALAARQSPAQALEIFLGAPELLAPLPDRRRGPVLKVAARVAARGGEGWWEAVRAILGRAPEVLAQAGPGGLSAWLKMGLETEAGAGERAAFFSLDSPESRAALDGLAGGRGLDSLSPCLRLYARTLTQGEVQLAPFGQAPGEGTFSPLAAAWVEREGKEIRVYLPAREKGDRPRALFRARLVLGLYARPCPWEFLLSLSDPWLGADLWSLAAEARVKPGLEGEMPGLGPWLRELDHSRRAALKDLPQALHPALKLAARRLWGGRISKQDPDLAGLAREVAGLLASERGLKEAVRSAHGLLTSPRARPWGLKEIQAPRLKFGTMDRYRPFEASPGLSPKAAGNGLTLSRSGGRSGFQANLERLAERMRQGEVKGRQGGRRKGTFLYPEWDYRIGALRPDRVRVEEREAGQDRGGSDPVGSGVISPGVIWQIRRQFERMRPLGLRRRGSQPEGEEVDLDAAVRWRVDRLRGATPEEKVYLDRQRSRRDLACTVLADLSGSTARTLGPGGPAIIQVATQGLAVLAEALAALGDPFSLYGFTGAGPSQVSLLVLKDFTEPWNGRTRSRLAGLTPGSQNRDGAALRHATRRLASFPARRRLLVYISDGRPDDYDYEGDYALADTRAALKEARQAGLTTFGITIDRKAREYVREMMGATPHVILDRVERLPLFLPRLYRRLAG